MLVTLSSLLLLASSLTASLALNVPRADPREQLAKRVPAAGSPPNVPAIQSSEAAVISQLNAAITAASYNPTLVASLAAEITAIGAALATTSSGGVNGQQASGTTWTQTMTQWQQMPTVPQYASLQLNYRWGAAEYVGFQPYNTIASGNCNSRLISLSSGWGLTYVSDTSILATTKFCFSGEANNAGRRTATLTDQAGSVTTTYPTAPYSVTGCYATSSNGFYLHITGVVQSAEPKWATGS